MNWEAIGAIGEIIGAIAVVASLIYLSVQIRHNSRQVEQQTSALNAESITATEIAHSTFRQSIINNPDVASLWRRAHESFNELNADEKMQAGTLFQEFCWTWHNTLLRFSSRDYTSEETAQLTDNLITNLLIPVLDKPGAREWWENGQREYPPYFVELVESRLK